MKFERNELIGMFVSVVVAVLFFAGLRFDVLSLFSKIAEAPGSDVVILSGESNTGATFNALREVMTSSGKITKLVVQDTKVGEGAEVKDGSVVSVHYVGMLQGGEEFDNSYKKGTPFTFVVGKGSVIKGWDMGLMGMKVGGERILVIPSDLAYGEYGVGPIPSRATLLFSIELLSIE